MKLYLQITNTATMVVITTIILFLICAHQGLSGFALGLLVLVSVLPYALILGPILPPALVFGSAYADPDKRTKLEGVIGATTLPWALFMALGMACYIIARHPSGRPSWFMLVPLLLTTFWVYGPWTKAVDDDTKKRVRLPWVKWAGRIAFGTLVYVVLSHWTPKAVENEVLGSEWGKKVTSAAKPAIGAVTGAVGAVAGAVSDIRASSASAPPSKPAPRPVWYFTHDNTSVEIPIKSMGREDGNVTVRYEAYALPNGNHWAPKQLREFVFTWNERTRMGAWWRVGDKERWVLKNMDKEIDRAIAGQLENDEKPGTYVNCRFFVREVTP